MVAGGVGFGAWSETGKNAVFAGERLNGKASLFVRGWKVKTMNYLKTPGAHIDLKHALK